MNLKQQINKLEQQETSDNTSFTVIFCNVGETSNEAERRWLADPDNPDVMPTKLMIVEFVKPDKMLRNESLVNLGENIVDSTFI